MNRPEQTLHLQVAQFLEAALTPASVWFHCPNGGKRTRAEAGIFCGLGVKSGIPDVVIVFDGQAHFIELKSTRGRIQPSQTEMMCRLRKAGARIAVARSLDEVIDHIQRWSIPLRLHQYGRRTIWDDGIAIDEQLGALMDGGAP